MQGSVTENEIGQRRRKNGRFPFKKKFGNFLLGISVWEKRVPFVTSPILGRPGRLIDRERHGTGDKDSKSANGTQIFHWEVSTGRTELPFQEFRLFRKISRGTNQKIVFHLQPGRNFRSFLVNEKPSILLQSELHCRADKLCPPEGHIGSHLMYCSFLGSGEVPIDLVFSTIRKTDIFLLQG